MKVLVTGATGFVGSVLMPELIATYGADAVSAFVLPGDKIPATSRDEPSARHSPVAYIHGRVLRKWTPRASPGPRPLWSTSGVKTFDGDIADARSVSTAAAGHSHIVHLAGFISYWRGDEDRLRKVNEDGVRSVVEASLAAGVERLIHISSVGAVGFHKSGQPADEATPFNWPDDILYMASKRRGQDIVAEAVRERGLRAVILSPASIMGPGDHNPATPHNELYRRISRGPLFGSFAGGLAIVDVRDLVALILKALEGRGRNGESFLVVGANLPYRDVIRRISRACGRRAFPFPIPAPLLTASGHILELAARKTGRRPLLTAAYGRLSGWTAYYDNSKSRREFDHAYIDADTTIQDGWTYFRDTF